MSTLKIDINGSKAVLSGFLDENSVLTPLTTTGGELTVNFKDVSRVNSCGVREWVNILPKIPAGTLRYEECPLVVVKQLNAVPDFQGKASVVSFFAPYFCEGCDAEAVRLLTTESVVGEKAPELTCDTCKGALNFDAIAGQYFSFIKRQPVKAAA
jgi:hypothetical protein